MHTPKDTAYLASLSEDEKFKRTMVQSLNKRGVVVKKFMYRVLARNEFPHVEFPEEKQLVLYSRYRIMGSEAWVEYGRILGEYPNAKVWRNPIKDMSLPGRLHFHFLLS